MRIIFREGRCKGIGIITKVHCDDDPNQPTEVVSLTESGGVAKPENGANNNAVKPDTELKEEGAAPEVEVRVDEAKGRKKEEKDRKKAAKIPQQPAKKK
jgi:hypothetical protein